MDIPLFQFIPDTLLIGQVQNCILNLVFIFTKNL